jgi:hypothetical protein
MSSSQDVSIIISCHAGDMPFNFSDSSPKSQYTGILKFEMVSWQFFDVYCDTISNIIGAVRSIALQFGRKTNSRHMIAESKCGKRALHLNNQEISFTLFGPCPNKCYLQYYEEDWRWYPSTDKTNDHGTKSRINTAWSQRLFLVLKTIDWSQANV